MIPFKYNVRNLFVRWPTMLLIAVIFVLIVAPLIIMLGFVNGIRELSKKTGPISNVIVLREGANDELFSNIPIDDDVFKLWSNQPEIVREGDKPLVSPEIYSVVTQELEPEVEGGRRAYRFLQVRGVKDAPLAGKVHGLNLAEGEWFDASGNQIVLGRGVAELLKLKVGDEFQIRPTLTWKVVGILDSRGSPFDSEVWAKFEEAGKEFGKENTYSSIVLTTKSVADAERYVAEIKDRTKVEVSPMLETKYYEELSQGTAMFLYAAIFIAIVLAIGGALALMILMFASVSQRIKDIGVLRVVGYSRTQILLSFLLESLLLALIGGSLGLLIGYSFNGIEQTGVMSSGQGAGKTVVFSILIDTKTLLIGVGFTLIIGFLGGLLPAFSAMRLKLLDSLR